MQQKFISDKIAIIGIGLIGASIALAIKHKKLPYRVGLYDHNADVRQEARQLSIGDEVCEDLAEAVAR
ncbi:MAG: prephenate/arogenate dehydrogenase family protein, partial [Candidatus Puniceispirillaceae bacterium]